MQTVLEEYNQQRKSYCGLPLLADMKFDTELINTVITKLHRNKAVLKPTVEASWLKMRYLSTICAY